MNDQPSPRIEEKVKKVAHDIHSAFAAAYAIEKRVSQEWLENTIRTALTEAYKHGKADGILEIDKMMIDTLKKTP
jgi:2-keto-3-deoxy-L-rhamnonate aldolase RhmA